MASQIDRGRIKSRPLGEKDSKTSASLFSNLNRLTGPAIILMAAVIAVAPLLWRGPSNGDDYGFHLISWIDAKRSISMGLFYPHWANSPNFGAGEPRFVFYPPISWMTGAVLGMLLPWNFASLVFFVLLLAATGLANRALARETMNDGPATLAGCAAIFLGYALFVIYTRCDFAEMAGGFWIPLLLLFALRRRNPSGNLWECAFDGSAAPLALILAGIWLSNGPVGIMACYLLAAVALFSALIEKSPAPVVRAAVSTCAGMGLASLYLIPAVWERNWASIQYAVTTSNYWVENSWLFARHADPSLGSHDAMLHLVSLVAVAMLMVAFGGGTLAWIRGVVPGERRWWLPLVLIPPAVLILLLPVSLPVWNLLPELRLLQFPWRWLVVLEAPMAICFAAAVWPGRRTLRVPLIAASAALFVTVSLAASHWWFIECGTSIASLQELVRQGAGVLGKPEYAPPGIQLVLVNPFVNAQGNLVVDAQGKPQVDPNLQPLPSACLLDNLPDASVQWEAGIAPTWDGESSSCNSTGWHELVLISDPSHPETARSLPEQKQIFGVAEHAGYLILRLRYYPAWGVKVNGIPATARAEQGRGLMVVPVPRGDVRVSVDWTTTRDVVAGRWVSGVALLLVTGLYLFEWRLSRAQLKTGSATSVASIGKPRLSKIEPNHPTPPKRIDRPNSPSGKLPKSTRQK
jgi:hypothetical protein